MNFLFKRRACRWDILQGRLSGAVDVMPGYPPGWPLDPGDVTHWWPRLQEVGAQRLPLRSRIGFWFRPPVRREQLLVSPNWRICIGRHMDVFLDLLN